MTDTLPPYVDRNLVYERLALIIPEGVPNRNYCTRELAASTVFTALYIGALEGNEQCLGPVHVYRMTGEQAAMNSQEARRAYPEHLKKRGFRPPGDRWYADNTREPIRDETIREGFLELGLMIAKPDIPTTSGKPRYQLQKEFAALFDPELTGEGLTAAIDSFQERRFSKGVLARVALQRKGLAQAQDNSNVLVTFPNQETRWLAPGPSSVITKAVIEEFAPRFLEHPVVLWVSESGEKVAHRDDAAASHIGLDIQAQQNLPDLILVDLGEESAFIVFVEAVATDGAMTPRRVKALMDVALNAGFERSQVGFITAYQDRQSSGFKKTIPNLAWSTFAWFASEPESIAILRSGDITAQPLKNLL